MKGHPYIPWYFDARGNALDLVTEAQSWWGTPFHFYSRAKGQHGGIDCLGFCEEVTAAAGLERWAFERSQEDYSRHVIQDTISNHLRGKINNDASRALAARWKEILEDDIPAMVGDLMIWKDGSTTTGRGVFHMGIMISPVIFMQCSPRLGVCEGQIDDPTYSEHLYARFRARAFPLP